MCEAAKVYKYVWVVALIRCRLRDDCGDLLAGLSAKDAGGVLQICGLICLEATHVRHRQPASYTRIYFSSLTLPTALNRHVTKLFIHRRRLANGENNYLGR